MPSLEENLIVTLSRTVGAILKPLFRHISDAGFTPGQFSVLEVLHHKGPRTVTQLTEDVLSTSGNITVVIDNLLKAGWIEKQQGKDDARKRVVTLSPTGEEKIAAYYPAHKAELKRLLGTTSTSEKRALITALGSLKGNVDALNSKDKET
ncbi:MarR family winged helix-turn-helix transcriptional regulator [Phaeobacter sp. C3_T13_0]|uniref:MarR family winged helix-turn-helix transcriptional regulator n=1 Tax=Phaeobacter cretensis TaxID=3342641 RepID=UPI0039BC75A5